MVVSVKPRASRGMLREESVTGQRWALPWTGGPESLGSLAWVVRTGKVGFSTRACRRGELVEGGGV